MPHEWSGGVTPTLSGYRFAPGWRPYSTVTAAQTGQHFAATAVGTTLLNLIHVDYLGTPRLVADDTPKTVWRWDQAEPFGTNPTNENPDGGGIAFDLPLRLPRQYYDRETNLHYNYFRDYDPAIGRYVQSDPIGLHDGLNTYNYVLNNPLLNTDQDGLVRMECGPDGRCYPKEVPPIDRIPRPDPIDPRTPAKDKQRYSCVNVSPSYGGERASTAALVEGYRSTQLNREHYANRNATMRGESVSRMDLSMFAACNEAR